MSPEELFVHGLNDLHSAITSRNEYDVLHASKILRQLLLDGDRLVFAVNRSHSLKISFRIHVPTMPPDFILKDGTWMVIEALDTSETKKAPSELGIDEFLKVVVGGSRGQLVTVKDVIKFSAINLGGVHFKEAKKEEEQKLMDLMKTYFFPTEKPLIAALRVIGRIVLASMLPLRNKVIKRAEFEKAKGITALFSLCIYPGEPDEDNFIFDCGVEEGRNRASLYVDSRGELTFRLIDQSGQRFYIRAGELGAALPYGVPQIVMCEVAWLGDRLLASLSAGIWEHAEVLLPDRFPFELNPAHFVVGSDCTGKKNTHMLILGHMVIGSAISELDKARSVNYFQEEHAGELKGALFKGNQFLHSQNHPNFDTA